MKRMICLLLLFGFFTMWMTGTASAATFSKETDAISVILIEASTGKVLYEKNADEKLPPASVTKVMTMLLTMEAIDSGKIALTDLVSASEHAASMGGSQIYLKVGETMTVEDLLKSVVVCSANDAAVALAEHISGSEESFVAAMNARAKELGMVNTTFENTNGLDDTTQNHLTTARDIAIMSAELIEKHPKILTYSSIWMDTIRDGAFGLTNTNRLIRFYHGANGLKTGSTSRAKFCISASAKRDGLQLIAVIMGSPTRDTRNQVAKDLLDFGFANYAYATYVAGTLDPIPVEGSMTDACPLQYDAFSAVLEKGDLPGVKQTLELPEKLTAPIALGQQVGTLTYTAADGTVLGTVPVCAAQSVERVSFFGLFSEILRHFFCMK